MTLKSYLFLMSVGTLMCWIAWLFVIFNIAPADAGPGGLIFFYVSLFLSILGTFSVLGFLIRKAILKDEEVVFRHVKHTFRQSILIGILTILALVLLSQGLLYWWNAAILIAFFFFIESIFFTSKKPAS